MTGRRNGEPSRRILAKTLTGIKGLDEITEGGLPRGRSTLVTGGPGCGKTLLGMEYLVRGARDYGATGVFMTFEENVEELTENVRSLGFDLAEMIRRKQLLIDAVRIQRDEIEETGEYDLEGLFVRLNHAIDTIGADVYLVKPVERAQLLAALHRVVLGDAGAADAAPSALRRDGMAPEYNILIIDDEPMARYVMASFFKEHNCVTYEAQTGDDGIRMAREIKPDLVLLDLHMPDLSGYDVLDSLKVDSEMYRVPVAVVTSASLSAHQRRNLERQTCAILSKSDLSRERMHELLQRARRAMGSGTEILR